MKKSVYSLVLMDEVIEAIDEMAYRVGTSRSNLINQILAERVALITPEMHMKAIFDMMEDLLNPYKHFRIQQQAADSMMSIQSVLNYKYNPTIRYAVTLYREQDEYLGELKMISRSQSRMLQKDLYTFFEIWTELEKKNHLPGWGMDQNGRWSRVLKTNEGIKQDEDYIAQAIVSYIGAVDDGLKIYCQYRESYETAYIKLYQHFKMYINNHKQSV